MTGLAMIRASALAAIVFAACGSSAAVATESLERTIVEKLTSERCVSFFVCDPDDSLPPGHDSEIRNDDDSVPAGVDEPNATPSDDACAAVQARPDDGRQC